MFRTRKCVVGIKKAKIKISFYNFQKLFENKKVIPIYNFL